MPKLETYLWVKTIRTMPAITLTTVPSFEVVFFRKNFVSFWRKIKILCFKR